jgi:transcriptional regulator with XRE-family HTH domain
MRRIVAQCRMSVKCLTINSWDTLDACPTLDNTHGMTQTTVPEWTLGWRLQRSLAHAEMLTEQMADELGVSRSTVSRWLNGHGAPPRIGYLKLWAMRCGVPLDWLVNGDDVRRPG